MLLSCHPPYPLCYYPFYCPVTISFSLQELRVGIFFFTLARFAAVINTHFLSPCPALPVLRSGIKPDICLRNAFQYASDCFMCGTYPAQSRTAVTWPVLTGPVYRGRGRESTKRDFTTRDSTTREFTKREYNNHDFTNRECPDHGDRSSSSWCES